MNYSSGRETASAQKLWQSFMMGYMRKHWGCSFKMSYKRRKLWGRGTIVGRDMEKQMSREGTRSSLPGNGACAEANAERLVKARLWGWDLGDQMSGSPQSSRWWKIKQNSATAQHRVTGAREEGAGAEPFGKLPCKSSVESLKCDETMEQEREGKYKLDSTDLITDWPGRRRRVTGVGGHKKDRPLA